MYLLYTYFKHTEINTKQMFIFTATKIDTQSAFAAVVFYGLVRYIARVFSPQIFRADLEKKSASRKPV